MEESGRVEGSDKSHTRNIDPLDATTNFLHAIPLFAISIALERDGQIVARVVYNPANDDMFVAEKGQGAFGGNRRLRVAGRSGCRKRSSAAASPISARWLSIHDSWPSFAR